MKEETLGTERKGERKRKTVKDQTQTEKVANSHPFAYVSCRPL